MKTVGRPAQKYSQTARVIRLFRRLLKAGERGVPIEQLATAEGVTTRTIYRDIDAISEAGEKPQFIHVGSGPGAYTSIVLSPSPTTERLALRRRSA